MPEPSMGKLKLLALLQLLYEKTDAEHGLTMAKIVEELAVRGIDAERKRLGSDIETLREFGIDVVLRREGRDQYYAIESRLFTPEEMIWLVDAVQTCPTLTEDMTDALIERVKTLASESQRMMLAKRIDVPGRVKMRNESVLDNLDLLQQCMGEDKVALFRYFEFDADGERSYRMGGGTYHMTPVRIVYSNDGFYYFVGWSKRHNDFVTFRVDRMTDIRVGEEDAVHNREIATYDPKEMEPVNFGMYGERLTWVTMIVDAKSVTMVKDKLGNNATYRDIGGGKSRVRGKVSLGPVFYGWVAMFGNRMKIEKPKSVAEEYKRYLQECMEPYE